MNRSRTTVSVALAMLGCAGLAQAAYNWYATDALTSNNGNWYQNGSVSFSANGMTSYTGGTMVWKNLAPVYPNDYQVEATIKLPGNTNGGNYGVMLRASTDANPATNQGTFYLAEIQNPTFSSGGACTATLSLTRTVSGSTTSLYSGSTWCSTSFNLGATINGTGIILLMNGGFVSYTADSGITSGQPGVSVRSAPSGNTMGSAMLGQGDKTAPNTIDRNNISTSSYSNRIDMQWKGPGDDVNGAGLAIVAIFRDGAELNSFNAQAGDFTDNGVSAGSTHSYQITYCDIFGNCSNSTFSASAAPVNSIDPRQVGLRPTTTSWGGGGENINILSGNLNFSLPLLTAKARGGMSLGIGLNYNSQNWRQDGGSTTWNYGRDVGYGYGVKLGAGSMQLFYNASWGFDHWTFTDSTGAEYRLDRQVNPDGTTASGSTGIWGSSTDGATFIYNASSNRLTFPSGMFWQFDCSSQGLEGDATARYPTLMQDTNGNQILIRYKAGVAAVDGGGNNVYLAWPNSSSRIDQIEDVRGQSLYQYVTYAFTYNNDSGVPHLTGITNNIGTSEGYAFTYTPLSLQSPWGAAFGSTTELSTVQIVLAPATNLQYGLAYDTSAGLTSVTFPYGGQIAWGYSDGVYSSSARKQREVTARSAWDGSSSTYYPFTAITHDSNDTIRQSVTLNDASAAGQKVWTFNTSGTAIGLISRYQGNDRTLGRTLQQVDSTWTTNVVGSYISSTTTTMDPGTANAAAKRVDQVVDQFGNLTSMTQYDVNSGVRRTYANTYLSTAAYINPLYIRNRLLTSTVTEAGTTTTLVTNTYDGYVPANNPIVNVPNMREFDYSYSTTYTTRGNVTNSQTLGGVTSVTQIDIAGNVRQSTNSQGVNGSSSVTSTTNYAAPSAVTVGSLTSTFNYAADLLLTQAQGPNGDTSTTVYDSYARPTQTTSKTGAVTYYSYPSGTPATVLAYTNPNANTYGRVARTTLDGFGRTIKAESGTGSYSGGTVTMGTVVSVVASLYAPCGCSPLGKLTQSSRPYAPGGSPVWTVYTYDGIGRTTKVTAPDGASQTSYGYAGAKVTVTDAAAKSKIFTTDAVGNLTQVQETDPNLGTVYTNYSYDVLNQLRTVSMPRGSYTQTRTFTYVAWSPYYGVNSINGVGPFLISATNPENGTVTTSYGGTLPSYKIDAKGQKIAYTYDSYARVTQIAKYPDGVNEDICQRVTYNYDTNPDDGSYTQYVSGRLATVHYAGANCGVPSAPVGGSAVSGNNYIEMFSYTQAGLIAKKKFRLTRTTVTYPSTQTTAMGDLEEVYIYDQEGKMTSESYPLGTTYSYTYDNMGRPTKMTDTGLSQDLVSAVSYGPAGELLSMTRGTSAETRTYNANGQLTQLTGLNGVNLAYNYPAAGSNNGQIASQQDSSSGETITYQYDSLKRLSSATSSQGWGQAFGYDGFGNLTSKSALSGTPPVGSYPADPTTNRLTGASYDANGNTGGTFDVANRMIYIQGSSTQAFFEYGPSNKRVFQQRQHYDGSTWITDATEYYFYSIGGKKIGTYTAVVGGTVVSWTAGSSQVFSAAN